MDRALSEGLSERGDADIITSVYYWQSFGARARYSSSDDTEVLS